MIFSVDKALVRMHRKEEMGGRGERGYDIPP